MSKPLRVLIVDDCSVYRRILRSVIEGTPGLQVVGVAANGHLALESIDVAKPDILTLDVEMPELDGLGVLRALKHRRSNVGAIMVSGHTLDGAKLTTEALELGAFDFVLKPETRNAAESRTKLRSELIPKLVAFAENRANRAKRNASNRSASVPQVMRPTGSRGIPEIAVVGASTGGPAALCEILGPLAYDFPIPVVVVQSMPAVFTRALAESLNSICPLKVQEAEMGMPVTPGHVYVAPGDRQCRIRQSKGWTTLEVTDAPPVNNAKPSIDYLFQSAASVYQERAIAVVLTGAGRDGLEGCRELQAKGSVVLVQDEESCVVYGLPRLVVDAQLASSVVPLNRIAESLQVEANPATPAGV